MTLRTPTYPIHTLFLDRWSPRSFDESVMEQEDLLTILEAARWAPSAYNIQPWRFAYSLRNDAYWETFLNLLDPFNQSWAKDASALVFLMSERLNPETGKPTPTHSFDAGAAWSQLSIQATHSGYQAHAMAGIDFEKTRTALNVPAHQDIQIAIAIGKRASADRLPDMLRERELPSPRLPLDQITTYGVFSHDEPSQ